MPTETISFRPWPPIPRLFRDITITEKLDGSNASILITPNDELLVGKRSSWITPQDDNFGFAQWVEENREEILTLGPGHHFGEWWGRGINRNYGMAERKFSLFNTRRWVTLGQEPQVIPNGDPFAPIKMQDVLPACVGLVPIMYQGPMDTDVVHGCLRELATTGSKASPGFFFPEGVVVYHSAANHGFKVTFDKNDQAKSTPVSF